MTARASNPESLPEAPLEGQGGVEAVGPAAPAEGGTTSAGAAALAGLTDPGFASRLVLRAGIGAWCTLGIVAVLAIVVAALATVSSVVMPLLFAVVLSIVFRPAVTWLEQRRMPSALASGVVVVGLVVVVVAVVAATVKGVIDQTQRVGDLVGPALDRLGIDATTADEIRQQASNVQPAITRGFLSSLVSGIGALGGFVTGSILAVLIMYYLLKDGTALRASLVRRFEGRAQDAFGGFLDDTTLVIRRYARGRTVLSAIVAGAIGLAGVVLGLPLVLTLAVVNFVGGFIPYIGAVVGGGLAVIVALADGGVPDAVAMLAVVLAANLLLENFVEPRVMGRNLDIHPVVVLVVTAAGGIVGGLVGLMLAVPVTVVLGKALGRAREVDAISRVTGEAKSRLATLRGPTSGTGPSAADPPATPRPAFTTEGEQPA